MILLWLIFPIVLIFLIYHMYWKRRNYPPGPMPLPFFGNSLSMLMDKPGYESFRRWTKQYGGVFTFWMDAEPYIIISTYDKMKETLIKDADTYVDKNSNEILDKFRDGPFGVVDTNGEMWKTHRRFALATLKNFGVGKDLMQQKILLEVQEMFAKFDEKLDELQDVPKVFDKSVANVINLLIFGYRFDEDREDEFLRLRAILEYQAKEFTSWRIMVQAYFPFMTGFLGPPSMDDLIEHFKTSFYNFFNAQIEEHRSKIDFSNTEESQDYSEAFLKEQVKHKANGDFETFSTKQLANMCMDLWLAGLDTTTLTISWAISYVLNDEQVLKKVQGEMDEVIGSDRLITMNDKNKLPYMAAVVNESQRCANILPLNLFHKTTRPTVLENHRIPAGTGVIAQISTVMLDESIFPQPYTFNPDRFMENGKLRKIDGFIPFSMGKRDCLGKGLAKMELFLFLANFFNRYQIETPDGAPDIDKTKEFGVTPRKFKAVLRKRHL